MSAEVKKLEEKLEKAIDNQEKAIKEEEDVDEKEIAELKEKPLFITFGKRILKEWQLIVKVIELILSITSFALYYQPAKQSATIAKPQLALAGLIFLTFIGYTIINGMFIVSRIIKDKIPYRTSALFSLIAALLCFISGIVLSVDRRSNFPGIIYEPHVYLARLLSAATALSFINAIIYVVDARYTFFLKKDF